MSENLNVLRLRNDELCWIQPGQGEALSLADPAVREQVYSLLDQGQAPVAFAAPGADLRLLELTIGKEERRHLEASLPFMLEESLSEDIDTLHFAREELEKNHFGVAVVAQTHMNHWAEQLAELPGPDRWRAEPLLLPWEPEQWVLLVEEHQLLLRYGACLGTAIERDLAPVLLAALAQESAPAQVVIYGQSEDSDRALLPAELDAAVEWRRGGLDAALLLVDPELPGPELRQGPYAPQLPYAQWWQQWRAVAATLAVALALHLVSGWLDYRTLQEQNLSLRAEIESVYREVNPRGAVVEPEKQLRRQLNNLRGGESGAGFTALLAPLGRLVAAQDGAVLASLNYSQRGGELRVNLLAPDFAAVEELRSGLVEAGLDATLESSSRSGSNVRARLRIEAGT